MKYWALGNETWGPWQVEQMTKEAYAAKAIQWAKGRTFSFVIIISAVKFLAIDTSGLGLQHSSCWIPA